MLTENQIRRQNLISNHRYWISLARDHTTFKESRLSARALNMAAQCRKAIVVIQQYN